MHHDSVVLGRLVEQPKILINKDNQVVRDKVFPNGLCQSGHGLSRESLVDFCPKFPSFERGSRVDLLCKVRVVCLCNDYRCDFEACNR